MIELHRLSAGYGGRTVLHDLSLTFHRGEVSVLLGPNGCGKSTLLRVIPRLLPAMTGEVLLDGVAAHTLTARQLAQTVAYLPQDRPVPSISALRMVLHGRFPHLSYPRRYRQEDYEIARAALRQLDAEELADLPLPRLSGGQRQKVYLAMALAQQTPYLLMDEPTTYLDIRHQFETMHLARRLAGEGRAVVLVLHDLSLAFPCADRLFLLSGGRLLASGAPEELFQSALLEQTLGVRLGRVAEEDGWHYYCKPLSP